MEKDQIGRKKYILNRNIRDPCECVKVNQTETIKTELSSLSELFLVFLMTIFICFYSLVGIESLKGLTVSQFSSYIL